jgi:hypothetical protein
MGFLPQFRARIDGQHRRARHEQLDPRWRELYADDPRARLAGPHVRLRDRAGHPGQCGGGPAGRTMVRTVRRGQHAAVRVRQRRHCRQWRDGIGFLRRADSERAADRDRHQDQSSAGGAVERHGHGGGQPGHAGRGRRSRCRGVERLPGARCAADGQRRLYGQRSVEPVPRGAGRGDDGRGHDCIRHGQCGHGRRVPGWRRGPPGEFCRRRIGHVCAVASGPVPDRPLRRQSDRNRALCGQHRSELFRHAGPRRGPGRHQCGHRPRNRLEPVQHPGVVGTGGLQFRSGGNARSGRRRPDVHRAHRVRRAL